MLSEKDISLLFNALFVSFKKAESFIEASWDSGRDAINKSVEICEEVIDDEKNRQASDLRQNN